MKRQLGKYELIRKLAQGGMGEVWLAQHQGPGGFQKRVVLKTLLPHLKQEQEFINLFFDEARIAASLTHPNIAQIYELGDADGEYFIAMEHVRGVSLRDLLVHAYEQDIPFPLGIKCRIVSEAASALAFAHRATTATGAPLELIHRDVSPQNVLVDLNGCVKLIDFGVAKAVNKLARTATGVIRGKYAYMSPEQAYGKQLDGRSDIFSLGIILWETICMQRLFRRDGDTETMQAVVGAPIPAPSTVQSSLPKAIDSISLKALERTKESRYATATDFQQALEQFLVKQRLHVSTPHVAAFVQRLFPDEAAMLSFLSPDETISTVSGPQVEAPVQSRSEPAFELLSAAELAMRIGSTTETDKTRGLFFNAALNVVARHCGLRSVPKVRNSAQAPKDWVDSLDYSTSDFLRVIWKAAEGLAGQTNSGHAAFEALGEAMMDALFQATPSNFFKSTLKSPHAGMKLLIATIESMISPGRRQVLDGGQTSLRLVLKEDVLPVQLYQGFFRTFLATVYGLTVSSTFEKASSERVELTFDWARP
jgi:eukaryotic-like serine/threonine-protein kinase